MCSHCQDSYKNITQTSTGHNVSNWELVETKEIEDSCLVEYIYEAVCSACSKTLSKTEELTKHKYEVTIKKTATCVEDGIKLFACNCGHTKEETYQNLDAHNYLEKETNGNIITYECACGLTKTAINAKEEIEASVDKEALSSNELELKHASMKLDEETLNGLGDSSVSLSADVLTEEDRNDVINSLNEEQLNALGDNPIYNFLLSQDGTVVSTFGGKIQISVKYDLEEGEDPQSIAIWFIADDGNVETIEAKYANGYATFETDHFSYYSVTRLSPKERCALYGHYIESTVYPVTCVVDGYTVSICTRCGESKLENIIKAEGHKFTEEVIDATCEKAGKIINTCTNDGCGFSHEQKIAPLGHNYEVVESVEATCGQSGYIKYECSTCKDSYTVFEKQKPHVYIVTVIKSTCTEGGYRISKCANCELEVIDGHTNPTGHTYIDTVVEPTCTTDGYTEHKCKECNDTYTDTIVQAAHKWNREHANCAEAKYCLICNEIAEQKTDDHNIVNYVCTICGKGCDHNYTDTVIEPTCTTDGYTKHVCTLCNHEYVSDEIEALGHTFEGFKCTVCNETIIEDGFFTETLNNAFNQKFTINLENVKISDEFKHFIFSEILYLEELELLFNRINKFEISVNLDSEYIFEGYCYIDLVMNIEDDKEVNIIAKGIIEDGILYAKFENINLVSKWDEDIPTHIYMPIDYIFDTGYEEINLIKDTVKSIKEEYVPFAKKLIENNKYVDDFFEMLFSKYFDLEEEDNYIKFTPKTDIIATISNELIDKKFSEILGEEIMNFIEDIKTMSIGQLLDVFENFGTSYNDISKYIDSLVKLISNEKYDTLFKFITDVYGLSAVLNKEKLYDYTVVSFIIALSDNQVTEEEINDSIDELIQVLNNYSLANYLLQVDFVIGSEYEDIYNEYLELIDKYFDINITLNKNKTVDNVELVIDDIPVNISGNYTSDVDYYEVKNEVLNKYKEFSLDQIEEYYANSKNYKFYYDVFKDKNVIVLENSYIYNNSDLEEYVEFDYEDETYKAYYKFEKHIQIEKTYYYYDQIGLIWSTGCEDETNYSVYMMSERVTQSYIEVIYYDIETFDIVKTENNKDPYFDEEKYNGYEYPRYINTDYHEHELEYDEEKSIISDSCKDICKKVYVCEVCNHEDVVYYANSHNFVYNCEFEGEIEDCNDGVVITKQCTDCHLEVTYPTIYGHSEQKVYFDLSQVDNPCNHIVYAYKCPCDRRSEIYVDGNHIYDFYTCSMCDLKITYYSRSYNEGCVYHQEKKYSIAFGDNIVDSCDKHIEYESHSNYSLYELVEGSTKCSEGVLRTIKCMECDNIHSEEIIYECGHGYDYYFIKDLKEYGYDNKIYIHSYDCVWCEEPYYNSYINSYIHISGENVTKNENNNVYNINDEFTIYIKNSQLRENCTFKETINLYINYDAITDTADEVIELSSGERESHNYKYIYKLVDGATSCEQGIKEVRICANCGDEYEYSYVSYGHYTFNSTLIDFNEYGCEHGSKIEKRWVCACGYNQGDLYFSNMYSNYLHDENGNYIYDENGNRKRYYTCYECDLTIYPTLDSFEIGECIVKYINSYDIYKDNEIQASIIFEDEKENHNWEYIGYLFNDSLSCEEGIFYVRKCVDCGTYDENYDIEVNHYHEINAVIGKIDLTKYRALSGEVIITGCPGGDLINISYTGDYNYYYDYDDVLQFNYDYVYRSRIDGYAWAYHITREEIDSCQIKTIVTLYLGINVSTGDGYQELKQVYITNYHNFEKVEGEYSLVNGVDCRDGVVYNYKCANCDFEHKQISFEHIYEVKETIDFKDYGSDAYIAIYGCLCGYEYGEREFVGFEYSKEQIEEDDKTIYQEIYSDPNTTLKYITSHTKIDLGNCKYQYIDLVALYCNDEVVEVYSEQQYTSTEHDTKRYVYLAGGSSNCYDGVIEENRCIKCETVTSRYNYTYHCHGIIDYIDLTKYGSAEGYIEITGCPCGNYYTNINYNFSYGYKTTYDAEGNTIITSYYDGFSIKILDYKIKEGCYLVNYIDLYLDYDIETNEYKEVKHIPISRSSSHNMEYSYELVNKDGTCSDGVICTEVCKDCDYKNTYTNYSHVTVKTRTPIVSDICTGDIVISECLCHNENYFDFYIDTNCDLDTVDYKYTYSYLNDEYFYDCSYVYKCAVTEPKQCTFSYISHDYTVIEGCDYVRYTAIYLYKDSFDDISTSTPDYVFIRSSGSYHNHETTVTVEDTNIPCYKLTQHVEKCTICGQKGYTNKYYEWEHDIEHSENNNVHTYECKNDGCIYYATAEYENNLLVKSYEKYLKVLSTYNSDELIYEKCEEEYHYMYYKGYKYVTYENVTKEYTQEVKDKYNYSDYSLINEYKYDFFDGCMVTVKQTLNGVETTSTYDVCKYHYYYNVIEESTCSQSGLMKKTYGCPVCEKHSFEYTFEISPKQHNFEYDYSLGQYYCIECGLHNLNGANGNVTLEDCSDITDDTDDIVIGYWNPYGYQYQLYVSLMLKDDNIEDNQIVLEGIEFETLTEGRYVAFSRSEVIEIAKELGYTEDMFDIRLSFVPVTHGLDLDYSITITE